MRKTETYFLRVIPSSDDLPAPVADCLRQRHPALCPRTIIFVPQQEYSVRQPKRRFTRRYGQRVTPERTLVFGDDRLVVIEQRPDASVDDTLILFEQIIRVDWAIILLYGYVSFTWVADQTLKTLRIEYNGVGDWLIRAELERLRKAQHCPEADVAALESMNWDAIRQALPLKINNYLHYALIPGESVRQIIFQPAKKKLRRTWRPRASEDRTLALTSEGIIVLEEAQDWMNYGILIHHFPLRSIRNVRFEPASDRVRLRLSVGATASGDEMSMLLSEQNAQQLSAGLARFAPSISVDWARAAVDLLVEPAQ